MIKLFKTEAIVLRKRDIQETDQLITFFTKKFGKIVVRAKGVRNLKSKRAASLDLFNYLSIYVYRKATNFLLTEVKPVNTFERIKINLRHISVAFEVTELLDRLLADLQEQPQLFDQTVVFLTRFGYDGVDQMQLLTEFKKNLLTELGFGLPLDHSRFGLNSYIESIIEKRVYAFDFLNQVYDS
jgi:DNA repair protein RecO (recombination protein O)